MIKVDIISGFLGAGKTTLIRHLARALNETGERIVIIENEFGEIGIDGKLLEMDGLDVYEITNGCLCCTLKVDFVTTLLAVAKDIRPDRILIEPSGIFIPADVIDIFKSPRIAEQMRINSILNVLDSIHYLKQRTRYSFFFENQLRYAEQAVMSKTDTLSGETLSLIRSEIRKINPALPVYMKPWNSMSSSELLSLVKNSKEDPQTPVPQDDSDPQTVVRPPRNHRTFESFSITTDRRFTEEGLRRSLQALSNAEYGRILRAKGFVKNQTGESLLEFEYVDRSIQIVELRESFEPSLYFIGENLDKDGVSLLF